MKRGCETDGYQTNQNTGIKRGMELTYTCGQDRTGHAATARASEPARAAAGPQLTMHLWGYQGQLAVLEPLRTHVFLIYAF